MQDRKNTFYRQLLVLVIPIAFQQFMLAMVSVSDAIMLGRLSQDAMSASSLAGQVQFIFNLFVNSMISGGSILAAQYWGKKDTVMLEKILGMVWKLSIPISFLFTVATYLVPGAIMGLLTSEAAIQQQGVDYLRAVCLSYLFCGISQMYLCIMKNTGKAAKSAMISSVSVVINIVLNAVLIFGLFGMPALGIRGAAYATAITRLIEMVWTLSYMKNYEKFGEYPVSLAVSAAYRRSTVWGLQKIYDTDSFKCACLGNGIYHAVRYHGPYGVRCGSS